MPQSRISKELHRRVFELTLALYRVTDFFPQGEALKKQLREKANEIFGGITEYGYSSDAEREAFSLFSKIQAIHGYLEVSRSMRMVKPINITVLEREYDFLADFLAKELDTVKTTSHEREEVPKSVLEPEERPAREVPQVQSDKDSDIESLATWDEFTAKEHSNKSTLDVPTLMSDIKETVSDIKYDGLSPISQDINERQQRILQYIQQVSQAKISDFYGVFQNISSKTIQRDLQDLVSRNILKKEGEKRWTTYSKNSI